MTNDQIAIKHDVEALKKNLREFVQGGRASVPEVLQAIISFSRQRIDLILRQADKKINPKLESSPTILRSLKPRYKVEVSQSLNKLFTMNTMTHSLNSTVSLRHTLKKTNLSKDDTQDQVIKGESMFISTGFISKQNKLKHLPTDNTKKITKQSQNENSSICIQVQVNYYQGIFKKDKTEEHQKNESSKLIPEPPMFNRASRMISLENTQRSKLKKITNIVKPKEEAFCRNFASPIDDCFQVQNYESRLPIDNFYNEYWTDLKSQSEKDQRVQLYRLYKEMLRYNQSIYCGISLYRRNYLNFIKRQAEYQHMKSKSLSTSTNQVHNYWVSMYRQTLRYSDRKSQHICDMRDISRIFLRNRALSYKKTKENKQQEEFSLFNKNFDAQ